MGNYEDWDPNWRPVGDPVSTDEDWNEEDSNEYDWSAEGSPAGYEPSEPSRPGRAFADLEAEYGDVTDREFSMPPDQDQADELRDNPELAVFRRWRAQLGMPVEPEPFPDESERAEHRPEEAVVAGPALPTDWASLLAAMPHDTPRPYEYEPDSQPLPEKVYTLEEGDKPWTPQVPRIPSQPPTFLQSELQRLRGWESFRQDLQARWDQFQKEYQAVQAWQAAHKPSDMDFEPGSYPVQPGYPELVPKLMEPPVAKGFPPNWNRMTTEERLAWLETLGPGHSIDDTQDPIAALAQAAAQANQYVTERTPLIGGAEKLALQDVPEAFGTIPRFAGAPIAEAQRTQAIREASPEYQALRTFTDEHNITESTVQPGVLPQNLPPDIRAEYNRLKSEWYQSENYQRLIPTPETIGQVLQVGPEAWRETIPLPVQILSDAVDPGYWALAKVLGAPKIVSQLGKWDAVKTALQSQGLESYVPFVEQMIKDAGGWGSKGASRVLKEADELFAAPARAAKAREGKDRLLAVLNEYKPAGVEPFTRDNLANRSDEVKTTLDEYASKVKGIDPLTGPLAKRWKTLPQSVKDDISQKSLMDAMTGLESRYAYELEPKPKGWSHAITDVNGLGAINKIYGEEVGNEAIAELGRVIKAKVEEAGGRAFRFGGDEIKYWFPDEETARKTLAAIDREFLERIINVKLPDGRVVGKKGFSIAYGYGPDELAADNALARHKDELGRIGRRAGKDILPGGISEVSVRVGPGGGDDLGVAADRGIQSYLEAQARGTARSGQVARPSAAVPLHERWPTLPPSRKDEIGRRALIDAATGLESKFAYELATKPEGWVDAVAGMNGLAAINEAFGHPAADDLLVAIGKVVKTNAEEEGGRAFRYSGDVIKLWFPDEGSARRALAAMDREIKERIFPVRLRDGTVVWKKGITISRGYGPDERAAGNALNADKRRRESIGERAPRGVLPPSLVDVPFHFGRAGEENGAWAAAARATAIGAAARAARSSRENSPQAETPRMVLQYLRQQLSKLGYSSGMIDQLSLSEAAQIIGESQSGRASARGAAPGGMGPSWRPSRPRPPLSISQRMAQLYRGTVAGDGYTRGRDNDAWAMVPDNLKGALEDYWRGTPLTRAQVQRLLPVYRRFVAQTGYPGDMVHWITATLKNERYPHRAVN